MSADFAEQRNCITCAFNLFSQQRRSKIALSGIPRRIDRFLTVERVFSRHAFAPSFRSICMNGEEKDAALRGAAKAGFKEMDQWHMNFAQRNSFNFHRVSCVQLAIGNQQLVVLKSRAERGIATFFRPHLFKTISYSIPPAAC